MIDSCHYMKRCIRLLCKSLTWFKATTRLGVWCYGYVSKLLVDKNLMVLILIPAVIESS